MLEVTPLVSGRERIPAHLFWNVNSVSCSRASKDKAEKETREVAGHVLFSSYINVLSLHSPNFLSVALPVVFSQEKQPYDMVR